MNIIEAIILGIVQGLTEFLPVSSSGHLVLTEKLLGLTTHNIRFVVVVHLGSLLAVLAIYRVQLGKIILGLYKGRVRYRKGKWKFNDPNTRLSWLLVLATIPAGLVGFFFGGMIERVFFQPFWVGIFLAVTGLILFCIRFVKTDDGGLNWRRAGIIGLAQAVAILPGMSRSGSTIAAGIYSGVEKSRAAEFSFLLSVPVILGAGVMELGKMMDTVPSAMEIVTLLAGAAASAISGYLAIRFLLNVINKGKLHYFAYYCWLVALIVIIISA
ncbi:MAG TPA: undecaprenyl-diphosphate phosphatase [Proteobacteria bacterium]|nr:undecaprenyl-diphosphate phosphatase [Pseudomonadota bacterium]